jgi:hypothetical protein
VIAEHGDADRDRDQPEREDGDVLQDRHPQRLVDAP